MEASPSYSLGILWRFLMPTALKTTRHVRPPVIPPMTFEGARFNFTNDDHYGRPQLSRPLSTGLRLSADRMAKLISVLNARSASKNRVINHKKYDRADDCHQNAVQIDARNAGHTKGLK
jgi:hypothetical protein